MRYLFSPAWLKPLAIWLILLLVVPAGFIAWFATTFGYRLFIARITLGLMIVLAMSAGLGIAWAARAPVPDRPRREWLISLALAPALVGIAAVFLLSSVSNAAWGDNLTWSLTAATLRQWDIFLADATASVRAAATAGAIVLATAALLGACLLAVRSLVGASTRAMAGPVARYPAATGLCLLLPLLVVAGLVARWLVYADPAALRGEPLTAFVTSASTSDLNMIDNTRRVAAIEDKAARIRYRATAPGTRRNVVLIIADSLRADHAGVYGYARDTTPFLSRLHAEGRLHKVETALSTCSESFCGIASTLASRPFNEVATGAFTLNALLRTAGYRVNFFLSGQHFAWPYLGAFYGSDFDLLADYRSAPGMSDRDDRSILANLERLPPSDGQPAFFYFFLMSAHFAGIRQPEFEPFQPVTADPRQYVSFRRSLDREPVVEVPGGKPRPASLSRQEHEAYVNRYDNGVRQADAMIERILGELDRRGYLKDSLVVITADHGEALGERGYMGHTRYLYQSEIRIPLLIADTDPGSYANGRFATQLDIAPTIVERLGLPQPPTWRGRSLRQAEQPSLTVHQTRRGSSPCFAAVMNTLGPIWKYIRCFREGRAGEELYEISGDPDERSDRLSTAEAAILRTLRGAIDSRFGTVTNGCLRPECQN